MEQKIALIQPQVVAGTSLGIEKAPESIQILAGQLEKKGYLVQMFHEKASEDLYAKLKQFNPDYVCISTMTANFPEGKKVASAVKKINPNIPVILGGWHASGVITSYMHNQESETIKEILNPHSPFDFVVLGEGDLVLPELVRRLDNHEKINDLKGVGYLDKGEIKVSAAERVRNFDELADPSWEGLPVDKYRDKRTGNLDLSVHFNRACRFACGFCSTSTVYGRGVETFNAERAADYIESLLKRFNPEVITFTDEDFFANPQWVAEIVRILSKKDLHKKYGVNFDAFASINDLHNLKEKGEGDLLDKMKQAGFSSLTVGIELFNPEILRKYNKELMILATMSKEQREGYVQSPKEEQNRLLVNHYLDCTQKAIDFAYKHKIFIVGDYIFGNLGESEEQVRAGFEKFSSISNLPMVYLPIFTPFPGTGMWKEAYDSGKLVRDSKGNIDWARFDASAGALDLGYDIKELRNKLELEFYTSEKYQKEMFAEIKKIPAKINMFRSRFEYLDRLFPRSNKVKEILKELK